MAAYEDNPIKDRARKARTLAANTAFTLHESKEIAKKNAKAAGKKLTPAQETRAAKVMQTRRVNDRERTASRAEFISRREDPSNKKARLERAIREGKMEFEKIKKASVEPTKKATKKAATKKPLTKSEKAFVENQKAKARTVKKTGVYPNTAN